ncbi:MAG: NAD-dependent epimerase [Acidobacteria bacterium]|nr:MAG: NAD-dependent epimerase [Acidobacteriota bacterium]
MSLAVITGSAGLVGSEAAAYYAAQGWDVIGIDNDMRSYFFGAEASTRWVRERLASKYRNYIHREVDIRNTDEIVGIFRRAGNEIDLIIHAAAQPSHDWAATDPSTDLGVNTNGTSVLLEATRRYCPEAVFIYMSTNKVYGDTPNFLPLIELDSRWEIDPSHAYSEGIPETMSVDHTLHSLFGVSKLAADMLVQEYGKYFGMKTACFRGGCLTGPNHSGTQLHGFLSYLMKCVVSGTSYKVFGYKGKQVRDNIHSADLIQAFDEFYRAPRSGEVYNMGGGRLSNCSMLEAIEICEQISGEELDWEYVETPRKGDHQWWISDCSRFRSHFPTWKQEYDVRRILEEICEASVERVPVLRAA